MPVKPALIRHFLPRQQGRRGALGTPPVDAFEQHRKLRRGEAHLAGLGDRPDETAAVHALREEAQALAVIPEQLDQIAALAAEREQRARVRTLLQNLLHQHGEPVEPLAHIGGAASEIDACRRRERDHRPRTDITRASAPASTAASTVSLTPDGSAIPIWPLPTIAAVDTDISTSANDGGAVRFNPSRTPASARRRQV